MNNSINTKECETSFKRGLGLAGLVTALYLNLSYPGEVKADTITNHEVNITEVINQSDYVNSPKVIDFDTAKISNEPSTEAKIDSLIDEYRKEYFQYLDSLSDQKKQEFILEVLRENEKIQSVIYDMIQDEDIINAIKLGDKKIIREKFTKKMNHEVKYVIFGALYTCICLTVLSIIKDKLMYDKRPWDND